MSQIERKATGCACGTSFKASTTPAAHERQEKGCPCCGDACTCGPEGPARADACGCGG